MCLPPASWSGQHLLLDAEISHLTLVDAGNFATEDLVLEPLMKRMHAAFPDLLVQKSRAMHSPAQYIS